MVTILMMPAKMATLGYLKIKSSWKKVYDLLTSVYDVTNKILLLDSIYIVNVVMLAKFSNSSTYMKQVIITSIL